MNKKKLEELMRDSWSYPTGDGGNTPSGGSMELTDANTGKNYSLYIEDGSLRMKEADAQ